MIKFTTGFLLVVLLLSGKAVWAEEKSSEHQKNISKAVSAQLLRMKLKKMDKIKADEKAAKDLKLLPKISDLKVEDKKPVTIIKSDAGKEPLVPAVKKETKKPKKNEEKQKKVVKTVEGKSKKPLSSQQKNDILRLKLQNLINSTPST